MFLLRINETMNKLRNFKREKYPLTPFFNNFIDEFSLQRFQMNESHVNRFTADVGGSLKFEANFPPKTLN